MNQIKEHNLGYAEVRVEQDLVSIRVHGSLELDQVTHVTSIIRQLQEEHGKVFILVDLREGEGLPPAMRRLLSHMLATFSPSAVAVYGGNAEQRGSHALLMGAVTGVSGRRQNTAYFQTESDARQWLKSEHQRLFGS